LVVAGWRCGWRAERRTWNSKKQANSRKLRVSCAGNHSTPQEVTVLWLFQAGGVGEGPLGELEIPKNELILDKKRGSCAGILLRHARSDCSLVVAGWRCGWRATRGSWNPKKRADSRAERILCAGTLLYSARSDCALVVAGWRCGWRGHTNNLAI
jgi:hypothetical protein